MIFDNLPSYPIRASLGFNYDDFVDFVKGNSSLQDVEFEIILVWIFSIDGVFSLG